MSQVNRLSARDIERLSAYLDGRLTAADAARLEERLEREASWREALEELRWTVASLRSLPSVKVPRSFALTPDLVGRRNPRWYPTLQLGTALAGLAFVVVVGLDALGVRQASLVQGLLAGQAAPQPASEVGAELFATELEQPPTALPAAEDRLGLQATAAAPSLLAMAPTPSAVETKVLPTETAQTEAMLRAAPGEGFADEIQPTAAPPLPPVRYLEIALGALTLLLGAVMLRIRRPTRG